MSGAVKHKLGSNIALLVAAPDFQGMFGEVTYKVVAERKHVVSHEELRGGIAEIAESGNHHARKACAKRRWIGSLEAELS